MRMYYNLRNNETATYKGKPVRILGRSPQDVLIEIEHDVFATVRYTDLVFAETEVVGRNNIETR